MFIHFLVFQKDFTCFSSHNESYKERFLISKQILGSDSNENFDVIHACLKEITENIFCSYNEVLKSRKYLRSVVDMKMRDITFQLLSFKIHEHLFS